MKLLQSLGVQAKGRALIEVLEGGKVVDTRPWQRNLILDSGLDLINTNVWRKVLDFAVAGTGTTPTSDTKTGTFSQAGTTVTRASGSDTFSSGDVGKLVRFGTGEEAKITAFIGSTSVTVAVSQTVSATTVILYRVNQTGLTTETKRSNSYPSFSDPDLTTSQDWFFDTIAGTVTFRRTYDFSAEVGSVNYTEVGFSPNSGAGANLFSRILLAGTVSVLTGQQLRVRYELTIAIRNFDRPANVVMPITGWPVSFGIASITSDGTRWEITTTTPHNYITGGKVNIASAIRPKIALTVASSTGTTMTLTTTSPHGYSPGDSVVIEGMTPSGYNGTWTLATTPSTTTFTITSALNPGAGTVFGTVRLANPGTWYNGGEYTIASTPTSTTFRITNNTTIVDAGPGGTVLSNTKGKYAVIHPGIRQLADSGTFGHDAAYDDLFLVSPNFGLNEPASRGMNAAVISLAVSGSQAVPNFGVTPAGWVALGRGDGNIVAGSMTAYVPGNFWQDWTFEFGSGICNYNDVMWITLQLDTSSVGLVQLAIPFNEQQKKDSLHKLTLVFRRSWGRDLS